MKRFIPLLVIISLLWPSGAVPLAFADTNINFTNITSPTTWNLAGSPYIVHGEVEISGPSGSLTIDPGVVVKFDAAQSMVVLSGGALTATGTITNPIVFTSSAVSPAPGDWQNIQVLAGGSAQLSRCEIAYGAGAGQFSQLEVHSTDVLVQDCTIHHGLNDGVRLISVPSVVIAPTLRNLLIDANGGVAIHTDSPRMSPRFENLTLTNNGTNAVRLGYSQGNLLAGQQVTFDGWGLHGAPLLFPNGLATNGSNVITITAGSIVQMEAAQTIQLTGASRLVARGTPTRPITFTTSSPSPAAGQWGQFWIRNTSQADLDHCSIAYAGNNNVPAIQTETGAQVKITNCYIHDNLNGAINVSGEITGMLARFNRFESSAYGIAYTVSGPPGYQFAKIDARNTYWGSPSGPHNAASNPSGTGLSVADNVLFEPWTELVGSGPDLQPSAVVPASASVGTNFSFDYGVWNRGNQTTLVSAWEDAFYLSADGGFDGGDILLGTAAHSGSLAPGANYSATVNVHMPLVAEKPWYVLVVADHNHQSPDVNRDNNTGASQGILAQVPGLTLNTPVSGVLPAEGALYKFTPPADTNVRLKTTPGIGFLLEERALSAPTASEFDRQTFDGLLTLRHLPALPQYVWIKPVGASGSFSLLAETFASPGPLAIASVNPSPVAITCFGCNPGWVNIHGAGFTPSTTVTLRKSPQPDVPLSLVRFLDENTLRAYVSNLAPGTYDVQVNDGAQSAILPAALTVKNTYDALTLRPGAGQGQCQLGVSLDAPQAVRSLSEFPVTINYQNDCDTDTTPQAVIISSDNAHFRLASDTAPRGQALELLLTNVGEGPLELIPPGGRGSILVMAQPITGGAHVAVPIDLNMAQTSSCHKEGADLHTVCSPTQNPKSLTIDQFRPAFFTPNDWASLTTPLMAGASSNVQGDLDFLTSEAVRMSRLGVRTFDVQRILESFVASKIDPGVIQRQYLGALGYGLPDPTQIRMVPDSLGNYFLELGMHSRPFLAQPEGGWKGAPGDGATLSVSSGIVTLRELDGGQMVFRADGWLDYSEDTSGNRITASYTGNQLTSYTDTSGDTTTFTYNGQGRLTQITDPVGRVTTYSYDPSGAQLISSSTAGTLVQFEYSPATDIYRRHAITRVIYPDGNSANYEYDSLGRLTRRSLNGNSEAVTYAYNSNGLMTATDALGHTSTLETTPLGVIRTTGPLGDVSTLTRDILGNLTGLAHGGLQSNLTYDAHNNVTGAVDSLGHTVQYGYEAGHNQVSLYSDPNGNVTHLQYDESGNLAVVRRADGTTAAFAYDSHGQPVEHVNRRGQPLDLTYDSKGLITRKAYPDGRIVTFDYDAHRNLTQTVDITGTTRLTTTLAYDGADRLTRVTYPTGRFVAYQYDSSSRVTQLSDQSAFTVTYEYDPASRLLRVRQAGVVTPIVQYTYDAVGRLTRAQNGNATATTYEYDAADRLTRVALLGPGDALLQDFVYTFDALGRRLTMTTGGQTTTYTYDATGQVISAVRPGRAFTYAYDAGGNRTLVTDNAVPTSYTSNRLNQYTSVGGGPLAYDSDGNLLSQASTTYQWDVDGQLVAMNAPGENWTFEYDVLGNRTAATRNGVRTEYLVDPLGLGNVLATYDGSGTLTARYLHGHGVVSQIAGGQAAYYGFDGNGNTMLVTNPAGAVANTYSYLPYGELNSASETVSNTFRFGGKWGLMQAAQLTFARARYYSPALGRFISEEPAQVIPVAGYTYAANDPVNGVDANGLEHSWWHVVETIGAFAVPPLDTVRVVAEHYGTPWAEAGSSLLRLSAANARSVLAFEKVGPVSAAFIRQGGIWAERGIDLTTRAAPLLNIAHKAHVAGAALEIGISAVNSAVAIKKNWDDPTVLNQTAAAEETLVTTAKTLLTVARVPFAGPIVDGVKKVFDPVAYDVFFWHYAGTFKVNDNWGPLALNRKQRKITDEETPGDPNDIQGPLGYGAPGWIPQQDMLYVIRFENVPTATISAANVIIQNTLDASLDPASVRFLGYGFGAHNTGFAAPQAAINDWVDASADLGVAVGITASINAQTGAMTWRFTTQDPLNGGKPLDSLLGFLPPDNAQGVGAAYVLFSARPKPGKPTGTQINAQATVIFDNNAPINTNVYLNTLDVGAPTASVSSMPTITTSTKFTVSWSGQDIPNGSGLATYDVWVAVNGSDWGLWQTNTVATSAPFTGTLGTRYDFIATATDNAGNTTSGPLASQAYVLIEAIYKLYLPVARKK